MQTPLFPTSLQTLVLISSLLIPACREKTPHSQKAIAPAPFNQTHFSEITPMADGAAYVSAIDSRLWYIRGNEAVRVRLPGTSSDLPELFEIVPAPDGSAYLTSALSDGGLWHLTRERAERVVEVGALDYSHQQLSKTADNGFFALYVAERKRRIRAEQDAVNAAEPNAEEDYDPPDF
jgi:hypothetical protein